MTKISQFTKIKSKRPRAYTWNRCYGHSQEKRRNALTTHRYFKRLGNKRLRRLPLETE